MTNFLINLLKKIFEHLNKALLRNNYNTITDNTQNNTNEGIVENNNNNENNNDKNDNTENIDAKNIKEENDSQNNNTNNKKEYKWSHAWADYPDELKNELRIMVYKKCINASLSYEEILEIFGTIEAESGFNPYCINKNNNSTIDYGIAQLNSYWYLKPLKLTPDEVLNNPEKSIDIMIDAWKKGRKNDWIGYKNGLYLGFLNICTGQQTPNGVKYTGLSVKRYLPEIIKQANV